MPNFNNFGIETSLVNWCLCCIYQGMDIRMVSNS